jgi:hypothetical protein
LLAFQAEHRNFLAGVASFEAALSGLLLLGVRFTQGVALGYGSSPLQGFSEAPTGRHIVAQGNALG